jgi:The  BURPS668_1122 family of deaminases
VNGHNENGGVHVPGRLFKYQVQLATGERLALNRPSDTEAALLEYVAQQIEIYLGPSSVSPRPNLDGKLVIYTELTPCASCQNIIGQFLTRYPGIEMEVYYSFKGERERASTPLADADVHLWAREA